MKTISIFALLIGAFLFSPALGQERFPSWVPPEAVQAAKDIWHRRTNLKSSGRLAIEHGISSSDLTRSTLRHPRKIVDIDYESYQPGSGIFTMLSARQNAFGFSVYIDNELVGIVEVLQQNQQWIMRQVGGAGDNAEDFYAKIYSQYPPSEDQIIYQEVDGAFFIVKDNRVVDTFYWDVEPRIFKEMDPAQYMIKEKARIEEYKKSDLYKHYLEIKKQLHEDSLKAKDASTRAPIAPNESAYAIERVCGEPQWKSSTCWAACADGIMCRISLFSRPA